MLNMLGKRDISKESYDELSIYAKDVQEELQGIDQIARIPHSQEFKNHPVKEQQELK